MTYCDCISKESDLHVQSTEMVDQSTLGFCLLVLMINVLLEENLNLVLSNK